MMIAYAYAYAYAYAVLTGSMLYRLLYSYQFLLVSFLESTTTTASPRRSTVLCWRGDVITVTAAAAVPQRVHFNYS